MSTIFTKYMPRATLPARIKAETHTRGQGVWVIYDETLSARANHIAACEKLCQRLHWRDRHFVAGPTPDGYVFVPCDVVGKHTHGTQPSDESSLTLPMNANGTASTEAPRESDGWFRVTRMGETAFRDTLLRVGIPEEAVRQLSALGPEAAREKWQAGLLRFTSTATEAEFVKALNVWSEHHNLTSESHLTDKGDLT